MPVIPLNGPPVNQGRRSTERLTMQHPTRLDIFLGQLQAEPMTPNWMDWHAVVSAKFEILTADLPDDEYDRHMEAVRKFLADATPESHQWAGVYNYAASLWAIG